MSENLENILGIKQGASPIEKHPTKYPALRVIAGIFKVLAWLLAVISVIVALAGLQNPAVFFLSILAGFIACVMLLAISESIKVFIDIEANTRKVAESKSS
jgi:hypothetical protein